MENSQLSQDHISNVVLRLAFSQRYGTICQLRTARQLNQYQGWSTLQQQVLQAGIEQKPDGHWGRDVALLRLYIRFIPQESNAQKLAAVLNLHVTNSSIYATHT